MTRLLAGLVIGAVAGVGATLLFHYLTAPPGTGEAPDSLPNGGVIVGQSGPPRLVVDERPREAPPAIPPAAAKPAKQADEHLATIPITAGFEQTLIRPPTSTAPFHPTAELHVRLAAEGRDTAWADSAEEDIRTSVDGYLDQHGLDRHRIELPEVHCGTTLCEIQAVGNAGDLNGSPSDWQSVAVELLQGSFGQDFSGKDLVTAVFTLPSGQIGYVTFLTRKPRD